MLSVKKEKERKKEKTTCQVRVERVVDEVRR